MLISVSCAELNECDRVIIENDENHCYAYRRRRRLLLCRWVSLMSWPAVVSVYLSLLDLTEWEIRHALARTNYRPYSYISSSRAFIHKFNQQRENNFLKRIRKVQ